MIEHKLGYILTKIKQKFIKDRRKRNEVMSSYFRRGGNNWFKLLHMFRFG